MVKILNMGLIKWNFQNRVVVLLFFTVLGLLAYSNALDNPFEGDDLLYVTDNINIRSLKNIAGFFTKPRMLTADPSFAGHYRPLVVLSYALNYAMAGLSPVTYHLTNLIFHIGSAVLLFLILKSILDNGQQSGVFVAFTAGLIFLVHPFNSEAVNYITARSSVMSGFFYLLGFWCWVKFRESAVSSKQLAVKPVYCLPLTVYYYAGSLLAFTAGMLSKEVLITLPVMLWLYDLYGFKSVSSKQLADKTAHCSPLTANYLLNWRNYIPYLPFILIVVIPYFVIRFYSYGSILSAVQRDIPTQIFTEAPVLVKYWQMFFFPVGLSLVHDININRFITGTSLLYLSILLIYIGTAIYLFTQRDKTARMISFFLFWFLIVLLPTTVISLNAVFQENRGYLAIVSFAVIAGIILERFARMMGRKGFLILITLLTLLYSGAVFYRNMTWDDIIMLNSDSVNKAPNSELAYAWLAQAYIRNGDGFLALKTAKQGIHVDPDSYNLRVLLALGYQYTNMIDEAIKEYKTVLSLNPYHSNIWNELGSLYLEKDDVVHAEICFREGLKLGKDYAPLYYNLGKVFLKKREFGNAIDVINIFLKYEPLNIQARYDMANAYNALGMTSNAIEQFQEIIRVSSSIDVNGKTENNIVAEARKILLNKDGKVIQ